MNNNNSYPLTVIIKSYTSKYIERKADVFYLIQINNNLSNKKWDLEKTLSDFHNLYEKILKLYPYIPSIPKITVFKITSPILLDERKNSLQYFLQYCINRKDILLNQDFINFLELSQNIPEIFGNSTENLQEFNNFNLSVKNFIYNKNKNIIIISCCDNDFISRDDTTLDTILMIKENNGAESKKPLGYVIIYECLPYNENKSQNVDEKKLFEIKKLWEESFLIQINIMYFDEQNEILCIGNDDGGMYVYRAKKGKNFAEMEIMGELKFHSDRISGLYINPNDIHLYSCSYDNTFFVTDLKDETFTKSLIYNNICSYTGLKYSIKNNIFIALDENGMISIFTSENSRYKFFTDLQTSLLDKINCMHIYDNYIIIGGNNGKICVIDISLIKDKTLKEIISFDIGKNRIICIDYNSKNDEIIIGDEKGRIIIWNNKILNFITIWEAHLFSKVNHLWFDYSNNTLLTCGDDKEIKIWKVPNCWFKEDKYIYLNNNSYNDIQKSNKNIFYDEEYESINSEEDELNGWSNKK